MRVNDHIIRVVPFPKDEECFDVEELASQAADALEAYRRAPWLQTNDRVRLAQLHRAIELLRRVEGLETERIPKNWTV